MSLHLKCAFPHIPCPDSSQCLLTSCCCQPLQLEVSFQETQYFFQQLLLSGVCSRNRSLPLCRLELFNSIAEKSCSKVEQLESNALSAFPTTPLLTVVCLSLKLILITVGNFKKLFFGFYF